MDLDKNIKFSYGLAASLVLVSVPMFGWKFWYPFSDLSTFDALLVSLAKIGAFGGIAMFAMSLILSGRYKFYEHAFGGLDKVYIAHRLYGTLGLVLLVLHPIGLLLLSNDPGWGSFKFLLGINDLAILFGAISLYGFIGIIVWSITTKSSYEAFLKVHKFTGLLFILGVAHAFISGSVIASSTFMAVYLAILSGAAILTYIFYTIMKDTLHSPMKYRLTTIREVNGVLELIMEPKNVILKFTPGQFVYFKIPSIDDNYHPFSISSGKFDGKLRFAIRMSGDYTQKLKTAKKNSVVNVKGPYGEFTFFQKNKNKKQLWIAGGIGVTPFLSGARSMRRSHEKGLVEMIYASNEANPYGLSELEKIEEQNPSFNVTHFHKEKFGHVSLEVLQDQMKDLHERIIYICGPPVMMNILKEEAHRLGLSENIRTEEFAY